MTVLLTRPQGDNEPIAQYLKEHGINSFCCPLLRVVPVEHILNSDDHGSQCDFCIITSKNALPNIPRLKNLKAFFVVGKSLAQTVSQKFPGADIVEAQTASDLLKTICSKRHFGKYLFVSGDNITIDFSEELKSMNFDCIRLITYQTKPNKNAGACIEKAFDSKNISGVALFSSFSAQCYIDLVERYDLKERSKNLYHFLLSEKISEVIEKIPNHLQMIASYPNSKSLCSKMVEVLQRNKG